MNTPVVMPAKAVTLVALGLAAAAMGFYVASADDAPGAAVMGMLLMAAAVVLGVRAARNRLPGRTARTAMAAGVVVAASAACLTHRAVVTAPLFAQASAVPSVAGSAPSPQYAAAIDRAREIVRAEVLEQNLPGVSVAVGAGGRVAWAEGFGWRDVATETPVTPRTRFVIGSAVSVVVPAAALLGLSDSGTEPATEWSPEHIGEPEEDFPGFTLLRHVIWQPLGFMPAEYPLPGERATHYVPRADDDPRRGRRLMYMRDLACCANGMAFYSTPSDLVRVALATSPGDADGRLAGGRVLSLVTRPDRGLVVTVVSNIAHANTSRLAQSVASAFAQLPR